MTVLFNSVKLFFDGWAVTAAVKGYVFETPILRKWVHVLVRMF